MIQGPHQVRSCSLVHNVTVKACVSIYEDVQLLAYLNDAVLILIRKNLEIHSSSK